MASELFQSSEVFISLAGGSRSGLADSFFANKVWKLLMDPKQ